jgi:hypothetical protein
MKEQPESRGAFGSLRVHLALGDFSGDGGGGGLTLPITAPSWLQVHRVHRL